LVNRPIHVFKEISKINEFYVEYTNLSGKPEFNTNGEFVVVVGKSLDNKADSPDDSAKIDLAVRMFDCLTNKDSFSAGDALRLASAATSLDEPVVRKAVKKARIARKRHEESLS